MAFEKDWRQKRVMHRTPGGKLTKVKISSLPAEEQQKYNPNRYKRSRADLKMTKDEYKELTNLELQEIKTFPFYIEMKSIDDVDDWEDDTLILATKDSSDVLKLFDDDLGVVKLSTVPIDAVKTRMIPKYDDKGELVFDNIQFEEFPEDMSEDEKFEEIKFGESTIFQLNLKPYLDVLGISMEPSKDEEHKERHNKKDIGSIKEGFYKHYFK